MGQDQRRKDDERDANIIKVKTQIKFLTRNMIGAFIRVVTVIFSKDAREYEDVENEELDK